MLIRRCAWHREFYGYSLIHGVASWRGLSVRFTDGVCRHCAARVRVAWHLSRSPGETEAPPRGFARWGHRRAALVLAGAVLVITALPVKLITDAMLSKPPTDRSTPMTAGDSPDVTTPFTASTALAQPTAGAEPPSALRRRHAPVGKPVVVRYFPPKPMGPVWVPVAGSMSAPPPTVVRPVETRRPETARPVHTASAEPGTGSISQGRAAEDELMRVALDHSTARLLLSPPEERPRHAGLTVQTP